MSCIRIPPITSYWSPYRHCKQSQNCPPKTIPSSRDRSALTPRQSLLNTIMSPLEPIAIPTLPVLDAPAARSEEVEFSVHICCCPCSNLLDLPPNGFTLFFSDKIRRSMYCSYCRGQWLHFQGTDEQMIWNHNEMTLLYCLELLFPFPVSIVIKFFWNRVWWKQLSWLTDQVRSSNWKHSQLKNRIFGFKTTLFVGIRIRIWSYSILQYLMR